jgi:hypothetical protein
MQVKYLSALKTKYASFGLSKEALDRVASQRVKTIANEDEIDADIASTDTAMLVMKEMQRATDTLRTDNAKYQKELADLKNDPGNNNKPDQTDDPYAGTLAEMKALMQSMKDEFAESKRKARSESLIAEAHKVMEKNGCTNAFIRNITLKGVEVCEADTAESIAEKCKAIYDQNCKDAFGEGYIPPKGNGSGQDEVDYDSMIKTLKDSGDLS